LVSKRKDIIGNIYVLEESFPTKNRKLNSSKEWWYLTSYDKENTMIFYACKYEAVSEPKLSLFSKIKNLFM
jgi:hypothetical protein